MNAKIFYSWAFEDLSNTMNSFVTAVASVSVNVSCIILLLYCHRFCTFVLSLHLVFCRCLLLLILYRSLNFIAFLSCHCWCSISSLPSVFCLCLPLLLVCTVSVFCCYMLLLFCIFSIMYSVSMLLLFCILASFCIFSLFAAAVLYCRCILYSACCCCWFRIPRVPVTEPKQRSLETSRRHTCASSTHLSQN